MQTNATKENFLFPPHKSFKECFVTNIPKCMLGTIWVKHGVEVCGQCSKWIKTSVEGHREVSLHKGTGQHWEGIAFKYLTGGVLNPT